MGSLLCSLPVSSPCTRPESGRLIIAGAAAIGAWIVIAPCLYYERTRRQDLEQEILKYQEAAERQTRLRDEERRGRTRAEQRLRQTALHQASSENNGATLSTTAAECERASSEGFVFHPIGTFSSCYRSRCGTPRQGGIVNESLAVLRCSRDLNPAAALEGFEAYSHCWVLYVFHENTNLQREGTTLTLRQQKGGQQRGRVPLWQGLCMKVAPPRCPNLRVGVLSCRTPHRPNPIGLSLARIVRVDKKAGELILGGLDVVDGTPCLDLKPYLPSYESLPNASVPAWVHASYVEPLMRVTWTSAASTSFDAFFGTHHENSNPPLKVWPFESAADLRRALEGTLALDIRSPNQKNRHPNPGAPERLSESSTQPFFIGDLWFHELHVTYALLPSCDDGEATASVRIEAIEQRPLPSASGSLAVVENHECAEG